MSNRIETVRSTRGLLTFVRHANLPRLADDLGDVFCLVNCGRN